MLNFFAGKTNLKKNIPFHFFCHFSLFLLVVEGVLLVSLPWPWYTWLTLIIWHENNLNRQDVVARGDKSRVTGVRQYYTALFQIHLLYCSTMAATYNMGDNNGTREKSFDASNNYNPIITDILIFQVWTSLWWY